MNKRCLTFIIYIFVGIVISSCIQSSIKKDISEDNTDVLGLNLEMSSLSLENQLMTTIEFDTIKLFDTIITDQNTLLFFFDPHKSCMPCVKDIIKCLDTIYEHQKELNLDDIILVSKYDNPKYLTILRNRYNIKYTCLNSETDPVDKGKAQDYSYLL